MAKRVGREFLRERQRREHPPVGTRRTEPVMEPPAAPWWTMLAEPVSQRKREVLLEPEPVDPLRRRANGLRSWGTGSMILGFINMAIAAMNGVAALGSEGPGREAVVLASFGTAFGLLMFAFWIRDVHRAAADGLDALAEMLARFPAPGVQ